MQTFCLNMAVQLMYSWRLHF